jgi:hypothetical protein
MANQIVITFGIKLLGGGEANDNAAGAPSGHALGAGVRENADSPTLARRAQRLQQPQMLVAHTNKNGSTIVFARPWAWGRGLFILHRMQCYDHSHVADCGVRCG